MHRKRRRLQKKEKDKTLKLKRENNKKKVTIYKRKQNKMRPKWNEYARSGASLHLNYNLLKSI